MAKNWENALEMIEYPKDGVLSKVMFKTGKTEATLFCMAEGTEIGEHTSTKEGTVYVLEGKGVFTLKGEEIQMLPGVLIHMERNAVHSLRAEKNTSFILVLRKQ